MNLVVGWLALWLGSGGGRDSDQRSLFGAFPAQLTGNCRMAGWPESRSPFLDAPSTSDVVTQGL